MAKVGQTALLEALQDVQVGITVWIPCLLEASVEEIAIQQAPAISPAPVPAAISRRPIPREPEP